MNKHRKIRNKPGSKAGPIHFLVYHLNRRYYAIRRKVNSLLGSFVFSVLIYLILRLLYFTMRITVVGGEVMPTLLRRGEGYVVIFWHARLLMAPFFIYPGRAMHVLISAHRDGEIIANVMKCFRFITPVRGSSTSRGKEALLEMVRLLRENKDLAITPDGPTGVAHLARLSGKAIVPLAFAASHCKRFSSWDRLLIPYPFSRAVYVVGDPLYYRKGENMESFRLRIEEALRDTTRRADEYAGSKI
jgi:lysophospholipid acyltransferase (LPLAT)-like uncharacterized protein